MKLKRIWKVILSLIILIIILLTVGISIYKYELTCVDKNDKVDVIFTIKPGMSSKQIAKELKNANLIHNDSFFVFYVRFNNISNLQASTYKLNRSMGLKQIIDIINTGKGYNPDEITITFKEGKNIRQIAKTIEEKTNNKYEDVMKAINDSEYIDSLIEKYWFLTKDIKNKDIYYPLEGYLFPNTYTFNNKNVTVQEIITKMLDQSQIVLNKYKDLIDKNSYSIHEIITFSSIVELEGTSVNDRPTIASVFYNRLNKKISLGSDVTTCYALKIDDTIECHRKANFNYKNPYNTRLVSNIGLPVGPICNPSEQSIKAVLSPDETDYLYFVADKNKKVYFFKTEKEFNAKIKELKNQGLWL